MMVPLIHTWAELKGAIYALKNTVTTHLYE